MHNKHSLEESVVFRYVILEFLVATTDSKNELIILDRAADSIGTYQIEFIFDRYNGDSNI